MQISFSDRATCSHIARTISAPTTAPASRATRATATAAKVGFQDFCDINFPRFPRHLFSCKARVTILGLYCDYMLEVGGIYSGVFRNVSLCHFMTP
jgi:hypothetical protein